MAPQDDTLTMIPGPTPVHDEILEALSRPTTSHQAPSFVEAYRVCLADLRKIVFGENAQPFVVAGSGTLAMEMALVNLVGPDERVLVLSQGYFGDRWEQLAQSFGRAHRVVRAKWGQVVAPDELDRVLRAERFAVVAMTHVDTSTGAAAPVAEYCRVLRDHDALRVLDGVCATAGMEERFDDWGLDVLLTGAQKALGTPPGVAILVVSERALAKRRALQDVPAYYGDLLRWLPIMDNPALYFSTPPVNEILALRAATQLVLREGLDARFARHGRIARAMRAGLAEVGLQTFTASECRADTLTVARYADGIDDAPFRAGVAERGVVIAGGLGPLAGKACRIGHMGNIGAREVRRTLQAAGATVAEITGGEDAGDRAVGAALQLLEA